VPIGHIEMLRASGLAIAVTVMSYVPVVAALALVGYMLGWRIPLALLLTLAVLLYRGRRLGGRAIAMGRARTACELLAFALIGALVGGALFGDLGVLFGLVVGFVGRLSEIPVSGVRRERSSKSKAQ
jgi:hypothetical protein